MNEVVDYATVRPLIDGFLDAMRAGHAMSDADGTLRCCTCFRQVERRLAVAVGWRLYKIASVRRKGSTPCCGLDPQAVPQVDVRLPNEDSPGPQAPGGGAQLAQLPVPSIPESMPRRRYYIGVDEHARMYSSDGRTVVLYGTEVLRVTPDLDRATRFAQKYGCSILEVAPPNPCAQAYEVLSETVPAYPRPPGSAASPGALDQEEAEDPNDSPTHG